MFTILGGAGVNLKKNVVNRILYKKNIFLRNNKNGTLKCN